MEGRIIMSEPSGNRAVIQKFRTTPRKRKTPEEIKLENENFLKAIEVSDGKGDVKEEEILDMRADVQVEEPAPEPQAEKEIPKMTSTLTSKKHVSLKMGVVGSGQAGGRIAEVFSNYGYQTCVINTAQQDLEFLDLPEENKLLIGDSLGGSGKDLDIAANFAEQSRDEISSFIGERLADAEVLVLAVSGGGGTGSGSAETIVSILAEFGKPIVMIYILPGAFDDPQSKHNAVTTLSRLAELSSQQVINSLVLIDNANIERKFMGASQASFFELANQAAVEPLHMFNAVSVTPTKYETLDSMDFAKSLIESGQCVTFGVCKVSKERYEDDESALMEAVIEGLEDGLLASGFDLKEAQNVGILVTARQSVLESTPYTSIAYMFKYVADEFDSAKSYKGVYAIPSDNDDITIRFIFSGMSLPKERVESLRSEAKKHMEVLDAKKKNINMKIATGKNKATSEVDRMIAKAKNKKTGMGKLLGGGQPIKRR